MEDLLYKYLSIYNKLPLAIKQFIGKIYSLLPPRIRYGSFYHNYLNRLKYFQGLNGFDEIRNMQNQLLFEIVNQSIESIPYYRRYNKVRDIYDFNLLPIIDKNIIREQPKLFVNPELSWKALKSNTGGSSGTPLEFFLERNITRTKEKVHFLWYWNQFGYKPHDKMLMIRGLPLNGNRMFEFRSIDNVLNVSCYNINEKNISAVINAINRFKPKFIHAYPSSLKIFTSVLEPVRNQINFSIKAIFLGSEYLSSFDRLYFTEFYNSKVVNWYGQSEGLIHGGNCPYSTDYHFYPAYGYLELIDERNNIIDKPGIAGRIIATGFDNRIMPFIRYDTGDLGEFSEKTSCECGFKGLSLRNISGRSGDFIVLRDGTKVSTTAFIFGQHLDCFKKIREMQIVQERIGEIELRIVKNNGFTFEDEESMKRILNKSVNNKIQMSFIYVNEIEKTLRGKNVFFISKI